MTETSAHPHAAYLGRRHDLMALAASDFSRVLDVGCAEGGVGAGLKSDKPCTVTGIELDPAMAAVARGRLDEVLVGDALAQLELLAARGARFDLVVMGDVLEHLVDPWSALKLARRLCPDGEVLVSLPNIAHYSTLVTLAIHRRWPYRDRGIHDRTHLRFFARADLSPLFEGAGFRIDAVRVRHRLVERDSMVNGKLTTLVCKLPLVARFLEYQYLCRLR